MELKDLQSKIIKLNAKTLKGKNKLHEAGSSEWFVTQITESAQCLKGKAGLLIVPLPNFNVNKQRWICFENDPDFNYTILRSRNEKKQKNS